MPKTLDTTNLRYQPETFITAKDVHYQKEVIIPDGYRYVTFADPKNYFSGAYKVLGFDGIMYSTDTSFNREPRIILEYVPRTRIIFEPTGAPPKDGEWYNKNASSSGAQAYYKRINTFDSDYTHYAGYTRREETY